MGTFVDLHRSERGQGHTEARGQSRIGLHSERQEHDVHLEIAHVVPDLLIPLTDPVGAYAAFDYVGLAKTLEESGREILVKAIKNTTVKYSG